MLRRLCFSLMGTIVKCSGEYSQTKRRKVYKMRWVYKRKTAACGDPDGSGRFGV